MKFYLIKGTLWRQSVLTFGQDVRLKEIFDTNFEPIPADELTVNTLISRAVSKQLLPDAIAVVLKPVPLFGWWNALVLWALGAPRRDSPLYVMPNPVIARVVADFFLINLNSISTYFSFAPDSLFKTPTIPLIGGIIQLKNPLYHSPTETPKPPTESSAPEQAPSMSGSS